MSLWLIVSIIAFSLSGLFLVLAVSIFITDKIPSVIGDLSGRTAAKQIAELRAQNASTGRKSHRPDMFNVERGAITDPVSQSSPVAFHPSKRLGNTPATTMQQGEAMATDMMGVNSVSGGQQYPTQSSGMQNSDNETIMLDNLDNRDVSDALAAETDLLTQGTQILEQKDSTQMSGTQVLNNNDGTAYMPQVWNNPQPSMPTVPSIAKFTVLKDVVVTHTQEAIQ